MTQEKEPKPAAGKSPLSFLNLSNPYQRTARLLPGLLCAMTLLPVGAAFGLPVHHYAALAATGLGIWAVFGVGISHVSSAAGNRLQRKLWPRWPHDAPTNQWLLPNDRTRSRQQKALMYAAIKRLTHLDIEATSSQGTEELEATINDAISLLRYRLRSSSHSDRLDSHNAQYGFARNLTGLRPLWLSLLVLSTVGTWMAYAKFDGAIIWSVASTALAVAGILLAPFMTQYVRDRAWHYAESFFSAVLEMDRAAHPADHMEPAQTKAAKPRATRNNNKKDAQAES